MDEPTPEKYAELIGLFTEAKRHLDNWPQRKPELWQRCLDEVRTELLEERRQEAEKRKRAVAAGTVVGVGGGGSATSRKSLEPQLSDGDVEAVAGPKYEEADPTYRQACQQAQDALRGLVKQIHFAQWQVREYFRANTLTRDGLLAEDWRNMTVAKMLVARADERLDLDQAIDDLRLLSQQPAPTPPAPEPPEADKAGQNIPEGEAEPGGQQQAAKQEGERAEGMGKKKGGRNRKYDEAFCRLVEITYDECRQQGMDSKGAWNKAAETHGVKSGNAARMLCRRYLGAEH